MDERLEVWLTEERLFVWFTDERLGTAAGLDSPVLVADAGVFFILWTTVPCVNSVVRLWKRNYDVTDGMTS